MRKLSLDNGKYAVEILPDIAGALSAFRWTSPWGQSFNLLRPASETDLLGENAGGLSCSPVAESEYGPEAPGRWTVQDASNVRATLTRHCEHDVPGGAHAYQLLQRFELGPDGLKILLSLTNLGVRPMPVQIGLRLRLDWRGESLLRGDLAPISANNGLRPGMAEFAAGFNLGRQDLELSLGILGQVAAFTWPEDRLTLALVFASGFSFLALAYHPQTQEILLYPCSHIPRSENADTGYGLLKQGDSMAANLCLSASLQEK